MLRRFSSAAVPFRTDFEAQSAADDLPLARMPAEFRQMLNYWQSKAAGRPAPRRPDLDPPCDLPRLVPFMMLWRALPAGRGFACSLAGTEVCRVAGRELRGLTVDALYLDQPKVAQAEFDGVARSLQPLYVERTMTWARKDYRRCSRLLLPLSQDALTADQMLSLYHFNAEVGA